MKKTAFGILAAAAIVFSVIFVYFSLQAGNIARKSIYGYISKIPGTSVSVEKVSAAFPPGINIHNITIHRNGVSVSAKKVSIYINLVKLAKTFNPFVSVTGAFISEPEIFIKGSPSLNLPAGGAAGGEKNESVYVEWKKMKLDYNGTALASRRGKISFSGETIFADADLDYKGLPFNLKYLQKTKENKWGIKAESRGFDFRDKLPYLGENPIASLELNGIGVPGLSGAAGDADFEAKSEHLYLKASGPFELGSASGTIRASINAANLLVKTGKGTFSGSTTLAFAENRLNMEELRLSSGTQKLYAKGFLEDGVVKLTASINSLQTGDFQKYFSGAVDSIINVSGQISDPQINSTVSFPYLTVIPADIILKNGKVNMAYGNRTLTAAGAVSGYSFSGRTVFPAKTEKTGKIRGNFELNSTVKVKGNFLVSKGEIYLANTRISKDAEHLGTINARAGIRKKTKNPFTVWLAIKKLNLPAAGFAGDFELSGTVNTKKNFKMESSLKSKNLYCDGRKFPEIYGRITYEDDLARLKLRAGSILQGDLSANTKNNVLSGYIDLFAFNAAGIFKSHAINGEISGRLSLGGAMNKPTANLNLQGKNIMLGKNSLGMRTRGVYSSGKISLSGEISAENKDTASFSAVIENPGKPFIDAAFKFGSLNIETVNEFLTDQTGFKIPLSGSLNVSAKLTGDLYAPAFVFSVQSNGPAVYHGKILPEKWSGFASKGSLSDHFGVLTIEQFEITSEEQSIRLAKGSRIDFSGKTKIVFDAGLDISNASLGPVKSFGAAKVSGTVQKDASRAEAAVVMKNFWFNQAGLEQTSFKAAYENIKQESKHRLILKSANSEKVRINGQIDILNTGNVLFKDFVISQSASAEHGGPNFKLNGSISSRQIDIIASGSSVGFDSLTGLLNMDIPVSGESDFTLIAKGETGAPYISSTLNISGGEIYSFAFSNANMQIVYNNSLLSVSNVRVVQTDKTGKQEIIVITGYAKIPAAMFTDKNRKARASNKKVEALFMVEKGDLSAFKGMAGFIKSASGKIEAKIKVMGQIDEPVYEGYLIVSNGEIQSEKYFDKIKRLSIGLNLSENKIEIKDFSGKIGEGGFKVTGLIKMSELLKAEEYRFVFETPDKKGIKIYIPELPIPFSGLFKTAKIEQLIQNYSSGEPHARLEVSGKPGVTKLAGFVKLDNTHFCYPPPKGAPSNSYFSEKNIQVDMEIRSGEDTWYDSDLINANISGSIKLTGSFPYPMVNGRIESTRGAINYINKNYDIIEAVFEVINSDCFLQAKAQTKGVFTIEKEVKSVTRPAPGAGETLVSGAPAESSVELIIPRSPVGEIVPKFTSKDHPELSSEQIMKGTYGLSDAMTGADKEKWLRQQLIRLFDSSLASPLAKSLLQKSGLGLSFRVTYEPSFSQSEPQPGSAASTSLVDALSGTRYVMEKYLTGDLLMGYALTLGDLRQRLDLKHEFELAYRWKGNIFVRGTYGLAPHRPETNEWQIKFEPRWRFGWWPDEGKRKE